MKKENAPTTKRIETIPLDGRTVKQALRRQKIRNVADATRRVGGAILTSPIQAARLFDRGIGRMQRFVESTLDVRSDE